MSDNFSAFGFIITNKAGKVLLLKGNSGWELPVLQEASAELALESVKRKLFLKDLSFTGEQKTFGAIPYHFVSIDTEDVTLQLPYTGFWRFGRFASFEEAWHIGRASQENVILWAEKSSNEKKAA